MEKIAIIGLSCLFPGAKSPDEFWHNLILGKDVTSPITFDELGVDPKIFYDPVKGKPDQFYSLQGGYIRDFQFDASEYNLPLEFLEKLDDTFKWSLYTTKQALLQSGYLRNKSILSKCGVILGNLSLPTKYSHQLVGSFHHQVMEHVIGELLQQEDFYLPCLPTKVKASPYNGMISGFPAALIAQAFSLSNINFCLDAACSSSFYAIKLASHYLWSHKADLMLAGAISCTEPLFLRMGFSAIHAYPDNGISSPLDKLSRGISTADGIGMVVLKRYSDAMRDGDKILATICGNGLSNDGRGKHLLSPNPKGQILAFERAYNEAQIAPKDIDYLECHATGTLLGDTTELNSIENFFGQHQATPLMGAVKANVGHLLTAAGMVSLTKVILSMSDGVIPPTINITEPIISENMGISAKQIVTTATAWPSKSLIKRAAINTFGFGGSNSHLILEKEKTPSSFDDFCSQNTEQIRPVKIAIVGMDAFFGECNGLDAFEHSIYEGKQYFIPVPPDRWYGIEDQKEILKKQNIPDCGKLVGAFIKDFEIDTIACKIPPREAETLNPQQVLMLKIANRAIQDAGLKEGENVAVIIAAETELHLHWISQRWHLPWQLKEGLIADKISLPAEKIAQLETLVKDSISKPIESSRSLSYLANIMANRISALWNFNGPSFTVTAGENSAFKALEVAQMLLTTGEVNAVVVGAVDLAGGIENIWLRNQFAKINKGVNTLSYDQSCNGWIVGEGAGALVLKRYDAAKQNHERIYAVIDGIGFAQQNFTKSELNKDLPMFDAKAITQACKQAFKNADIHPPDIHYLEVFGSGILQQDEAEITGLLHAYRQSENGLDCAIGSVKANIGHTYVASGIASLIKTALCLYHRYIPATPKWSGVKMPELWQDSPFYVAPESRPWFLNKEGSRRVAAINGMGIDGTYSHIILSEEPSQQEYNNRYLQQIPFYLFPLAADKGSELLEQIRNLQETIENCSSLSAAASLTFTAFQQCQEAKYVLSIVGHNKKELVREIEYARKGVNNAFDRGEDWQTPLGSYFTAKPLGKQGAIAYVYPTTASSFLGIGREMFRLFPKVYEYLTTKNLYSRIANIGTLLYPRSLNKLSTRQLETLEKQFLENPMAMCETEIKVAKIYTAILQDIFLIQPKFIFGYSQGEISMMVAQGVWSNFHQHSNIFNSSPLFGNRLSGLKNAVREYWGLPITLESSDQDFWSTYFLIATPSQVRECIKNEHRVYLTQINTPEEVLIAGDTQACQRVIKTLGCDALPAPFNHVMHCEAMHTEYDELVKLNTLPIQKTPDMIFYSAADYAPITLDSNAIAHSIAKVMCKQVDFPQLVNQVYEDGARIFIEVGAGSSCSRSIDKILNSKEHMTVALNRKGIDDHTSMLKALAKLLSHQVSLNLSSLYTQAEEISTQSQSMHKTITLGGHKIMDTILNKENIKLFQSFSRKIQQQPNIYQYQNPISSEELEIMNYSQTTNSILSSESHSSKNSLLINNPQEITMNNIIEENTQPTEELTSAEETANRKLISSTPKLDQMHKLSNSVNNHILYQKMIANNSIYFQRHATFLKSRHENSQQISELIKLQFLCIKKMIKS